jgi:hypothetical protein
MEHFWIEANVPAPLPGRIRLIGRFPVVSLVSRFTTG